MRVTGKQISLEAAMLLGVPFTWPYARWHKFVHGDNGLELWANIEGQWVRICSGSDLERFVEDIIRRRILTVEPDEQEAVDADHREKDQPRNS